MDNITYIHLSDVHFESRNKFNRERVLEALWSDIRQRASRISARVEKIDFAVITGDIAYHGEEQEYDLASEQFLTPLLESVGQTVPIYVVPGNHDINRDMVTMGARAIGNSLQSKDQVNSLLETPSDRSVVFARMNNYVAFFRDRFPAISLDEMGFSYAESFSAGDVNLSVLGLNSAWLSYGGDEDKGRLCLGEQQVHRAITKARDSDIIIALMHHPFGWYRDSDDSQAVESLLRRNCHFILHGHLHRPNVVRESTLDGETIILPAGAIYDTTKSPLGYNLVTIDPRQRKATIHLRSYSWDRQEWVRDIQSTGDESNGQIDVRLPRKQTIRPPKGSLSFSADHPDGLPLEESGWIVTLVGDSSHGFFSEVIRGISDTLGGLSRNGAPLSTIVCSHDDRSWVEEAHLRNLIQKPIAGMIIAASSDKNPNGPLFEAFVEKHIPIVQIDRRIEGIEGPWVGIDNVSAGYAATSHLVQHGHLRIAAIGGRPEVSTNRDRFDGFCKALGEVNGAEGISLWNCSHWEASRVTIKEVLSRRDRPTALFCMSGMATLGAMLAAREGMLRVPEDVALVGFDDSPWCLLAEPPITMIRQPARAIGERAAELVWKALYQNSTEAVYYCPWELVLRRSCGCE